MADEDPGPDEGHKQGPSGASATKKSLQHHGKRMKKASSKQRTRNKTVEELLKEIDYLTESLESANKSSAPRKQYAKHILCTGSIDNKTGRRKVHCPRKTVKSAKKNGSCSNENLNSPDIDPLHFDDIEIGSIDDADSDNKNEYDRPGKGISHFDYHQSFMAEEYNMMIKIRNTFL